MNLLDRHILRSIVVACAAAVCMFAFVLMAGNIVRDLLGPLLLGQLQLLMFGRLVLLLVPFVLSYALPLGMLTGVLLTLGRLSSDSEITAMRAAGISIARIAVPVLALAALGVALGLRVNFESMPWAKIQYERQFAAAVRANPLSFIVPKKFIREFPGVVIYIGSMKGSDVRDVWVWQLDDERRVLRFVHAESGRVDYDEVANDFIVTLASARIEEHDRKKPEDFSQPLMVNSFGEVDPVRLSLARYFGTPTVHQKLRWMTYGELMAERARLEREPVPAGMEKERGRDLMKVALTVQEKFSMAVAIFTFAFVGIPLGIKVSRRETSANLGIAVLLSLGYYFLNVMVGWLDQHPEYRPDLLLWVPNAFFLALGLWLLRRLDRA
ncbi:MAG TPA: LptF/LptG family permease [Opitutaceae bacterium]|nr:LptF/LptG family permease [Opitutaceae bacterium]